MRILELRLDGLGPFEQLCWAMLAEQFAGFCISEISLLVDPRALDLRLRGFLDNRPTSWHLDGGVYAEAQGAGDAVAIVSSARNLLPGLLGRVDRLIVKPTEEPKRLEPHFYWNRQSTGQFGAVLEQAAVEVFGPDVRKQLAEYLSSLAVLKCRATLITSVFDSDRFMEGFLSNMAAIDGYQDMQHFLIRAGSPGNEERLLLDHVREHPGAIYIDLPVDPGLYETWNFAASMASGPYLSNANVDDRRAPKQVEVLANLLDLEVGADVASSALRVTEKPNLPWRSSRTCETWFTDGHDEIYSVDRLFAKSREGGLRARNLPHCMPLWRRSIHALRGYFNERQYGPSADWEMWLRTGVAGSRFVRTTKPYGLYLKHDASYWRRDNSARLFDDRILERFGPVAMGRPGGLPAPGQPWGDLTRFLEARDWFGVMVSLVRLQALPVGAGLHAASTQKLASAFARQYFGVAGSVPLDPDCLQGSTLTVLERLEPFLLGYLLDFLEGASPGAERAMRQADRWRRLLVKWHLLTDCLGPLIALARLQREFYEEPVAERRLLHAIHARDPEAFWREVQRVYRFSSSLEELVNATGALITPPKKGNAGYDAVRLVYFPSYTNKYQELLYWSPRREGMRVEGVKEVSALERLQPEDSYINIVHLHWLNAVFDDVSIPIEQAADHFLDVVRALKERGFRVYWTVHNRLSHDTGHPQIEGRFRAKLAGLVDRLYIHHPMSKFQLDWLPDGIRPWLCEHGPYVNTFTGNIDRATARQRVGLEAGQRIFLWFGKVRPYKGLEEHLPWIVERLAACGNGRLIVAGQVLSDEVKSLLGRYPGQILFINRFVSNAELQHLAYASDFGLLTYREILTSGAMFHLFGMGLPVIAPDKGLLSAYVVPGWNGYLYSDGEELGQIIDRVCNMPDDELSAFSRAAGQTEKGFRWGRVTA
jgi:glycosyltransferase involved in cell wall biosynthesis